jgi:hypothetical protein
VPAMIANHGRPCLSQAANRHHVPCASSACRTRMRPVLLPSQVLRAVVVLVLVLEVVGSRAHCRGQIGRRRRRRG